MNRLIGLPAWCDAMHPNAPTEQIDLWWITALARELGEPEHIEAALRLSGPEHCRLAWRAGGRTFVYELPTADFLRLWNGTSTAMQAWDDRLRLYVEHTSACRVRRLDARRQLRLALTNGQLELTTEQGDG